MNTNKKKILIVDDDPVVQQALAITLQAHQYEVLRAADGAEGVNIARTQRPDAILLDLNFPNDFSSVAWNGLRILEWLKRMDEAGQTPMFIITAADPDKYAERARELGAVGVLRKPVPAGALIAALDRVFTTEPTVARASL
ncbi:MAG TPA: response regulator [Verrucomicrobiota bacterium]|nr:response regulator [Verrucomicrobiota bacterium]HNT13508.1 response regulator [Verrucomicrobiota bacterium]